MIPYKRRTRPFAPRRGIKLRGLEKYPIPAITLTDQLR